MSMRRALETTRAIIEITGAILIFVFLAALFVVFFPMSFELWDEQR